MLNNKQKSLPRGIVINIFEYLDYKLYINDLVKFGVFAKKGAYTKIANFLGVHTTLISQIFKRNKELTLEQGIKLTEFLGLNKDEKKYFVLLVNYSRAGSHSLKEFYMEEIITLQKNSENITHKMKSDITLTEEQKRIFYSKWYYTAIRNLSNIEKFQTVEAIQNYFGLNQEVINHAIQFLCNLKLCERNGNQIKLGPTFTHIGQDSLSVWQHHTNWRLKGIERHQHLDETELMFTAPLTISKSDKIIVRKKIVKFIEELKNIVSQSNPEELICLNIDWIKIK